MSRFALLIPIGGGVALAGILAHLARRSDTKAYQYALVLSIAITLSFSLPHPARYESSDAFLSAFYEQMALEPGDHAVLNVPASFAGAKGGAFLYEYAQTVHGKPIVSGYVAREPDFVHETYERWPFLDAVRARPYERDGRLRLGAGALASAAETLRALRIRYVIVHKSLLEAPEWLRVNGWLASALGRATKTSGSASIGARTKATRSSSA